MSCLACGSVGAVGFGATGGLGATVEVCAATFGVQCPIAACSAGQDGSPAA